MGIAPEEHRKGLEDAPGCGLKIMMDARDMKFLGNTFDTATAFFTLMYIGCEGHGKVFSEVYRVLKPGGRFLLWDMAVPENTEKQKTVILMGIEVHLKDRKVLTGYGTKWSRVQNLAWFRGLAEEAGFTVLESKEEGGLVHLDLRKG